MRRFHLGTVLVLALLLSCRPVGTSPRSVAKDLEPTVVEIFGKPVEVTRITGVATGGGPFLLKDAMGDLSRGVFIGVSDVGHVYLMADGYRFDGEMFLRHGKTRETELASPGLLVHFPGLTPEVVARVKEEMTKAANIGTFATCVHGACAILNKAGVRIPGSYGMLPVSITTLMNDVLSGDVRDTRGEPVELQLYEAGPSSATEVLAYSQGREAELMINTGLVGLFAGSIAVAPAIVLALTSWAGG